MALTKVLVKEQRLVGRAFICVFVLFCRFEENGNMNGHLDTSVHNL